MTAMVQTLCNLRNRMSAGNHSLRPYWVLCNHSRGVITMETSYECHGTNFVQNRRNWMSAVNHSLRPYRVLCNHSRGGRHLEQAASD